MRAGKENPRDSVEEGGFPTFIGRQAAGEGAERGGGRGCNNLKTGGDSGSSSEISAEGGRGGIYKDLYKVPRTGLGRGGAFEHEGWGKERSLPDPHSQPPIRRLQAQQPLLPRPKAECWSCREEWRSVLGVPPAPAPPRSLLGARCPMRERRVRTGGGAPAEPTHPLVPSFPREQQRTVCVPKSKSEPPGAAGRTPPRPGRPR